MPSSQIYSYSDYRILRKITESYVGISFSQLLDEFLGYFFPLRRPFLPESMVYPDLFQLQQSIPEVLMNCPQLLILHENCL